MDKYIKFWVFVILLLFAGSIKTASGRTVTFTRVMVEAGLDGPHGDWAGDIDGTSPPYTLDIFATIAYDAKVVWYENSAQGTLWQEHLIFTSSFSYCFEVAAADLDGDGDVDAVSSHYSSPMSGTNYIHTNGGTGSFTTTPIGTMNARFRQIRVRDIDDDGDTDIVVISNDGLYWYRNEGGMSFTEIFIGDCEGWKLDCLDSDSDGHLEIVISEGEIASTYRLILYKNDGAENFSPVVLNSFSETAIGVRCADFNGDGNEDIVSGNRESNGFLYWYENSGTGTFIKHEIDNNCPAIDGIDVGDFEPDGDMDIVAAGRDSWFRWYENDGTGNFTPHIIDTQYELFDLPYVTYLDGDTCPDIVLTEASHYGYVFAYLNPCDPSGTEETKITPANTYLKVPSLISNELVNLEYGIEKRSSVKLEVIDITGRTVQVIENSDYKEPGTHKIDWNLSGEPNGIYFLRLETGNHLHIVKKITVIR